tara:strand:+ start:7355 stop:8095 length:741 start_codon:yes stop_codon:yes gene_type:complete
VDGDLRLEQKGGVIALERGLSILSAFGNERSALRLTDIAEITGLNKSTILRLCVSLERQGFIKRREDGWFQLGAALFHLGSAYQRSFQIVDVIDPVMQALVNEFNECSTFTVRDGNSVVCLHKVESSQGIRDAGSSIGDRYDLNNGASSQVLRAFSGEDGENFDQIRDTIHATSFGTLYPDAAAIACPLFGMGGDLLGALQLSGPQYRFSETAMAAMKQGLLHAVAGLTRSLGGNTDIYRTNTDNN